MRSKAVICRDFQGFQRWLGENHRFDSVGRYRYCSSGMELRGRQLEDVIFVSWPRDQRQCREVEEELMRMGAMIRGDAVAIERFLEAE